MTVKTMTTMLSLSLSIGLLASSALASPYSQIDSKKPLLTPMAHTNQDDEEKSMILIMPTDKYLGTSGIGAVDSTRDPSLIEIAILSSSPVLDTASDNLGILDDGAITTNDLTAFDTGSGFLPPVAPGSGMSSNSGSTSSPVVPAPGVLGLLALAGLASGRRRRR
ncbi:MAG: MYXO-CTERM sorting domain-containing protein [Planctomycetota bacterium]|nr:MYXO-CTERM sorting domain-containing protein [Planctomycetota bacterium]